MDATSPRKNIVSAVPAGTGPLTREKVRVRARALALIDGRTPVEVLQADYEQAKRELTGKFGLAQQEAMLDLLPETTLAVEAISITGHQIPEFQNERAQLHGHRKPL